MRTFRKLLIRKSMATLLLVLLLVLSTTVSTIGCAAWIGSNEQLEIINSQYTTIAIHSGKNSSVLRGSYTRYGLSSWISDHGLVYTSTYDAQNWGAKSEYFIGGNQNYILSANVADSTPITSGSMSIECYSEVLDSFCYNLSVFAARCVSVTEPEQFLGEDYNAYDVIFEIIDPVTQVAAYDLPPENDTLLVSTELFDRDGSVPFEPGKTYLLRGVYWDYPIALTGAHHETNEDGSERVVQEFGRDPDLRERMLFLDGGGHLATSGDEGLGVRSGVKNFVFEKMQYSDSDTCYWTTPVRSWPFYAEYEGDWRDFLESEEGTVWREEIIPNFEMNHASATVIVTGDVDSLLYFNTGDASILEGRKFENTEYENGDAVCLVSASYAQLNGLNVGDTINLDFYNTGYNVLDYGIGNSMGRIGETLVRYPLTEDTRMDIQKDYTIVGIYTAPEWVGGVHAFHADTIFVPMVSVPGMEDFIPQEVRYYNSNTIPMLSSIVIENGSIEEFEAHMAENGMDGVYVYFDQGYSEAVDPVEAMIENAQRLMFVGIAMFVLASLVFLLLYARRIEPVARSMRLLGVRRGRVWQEAATNYLGLTALSVILGNLLCTVLFDYVIQQLLSSALTLSLTTVVMCAGVQFAILSLLGLVVVHIITSRNLMQRK